MVGCITAGRSGRAGSFIIEGARQDAGGRRLADAAQAGEQIGLMNAAEVEGIRQRFDHRLLADQVLETRRPVFARQDAIRRGRLVEVEGRCVHRFGLLAEF